MHINTILAVKANRIYVIDHAPNRMVRSAGILTEAKRQSILPGMTLSARNRLEGTVTEIQLGVVMAHVVVRVGKNLVESVITKRSVDEMKLKVGDNVSAVIKSTEVMLEKD